MLTRRIGHTTAAIQGVKFAPNGVLVCFNQQQARMVKAEHDVQTITIDRLDMLRGTTKQVVFDHTVVEVLLADKSRLQAQLSRESETRSRYEMQLVTVCLGFDELQQENAELLGVIQSLEQQLSGLKSRPKPPQGPVTRARKKPGFPPP